MAAVVFWSGMNKLYAGQGAGDSSLRPFGTRLSEFSLRRGTSAGNGHEFNNARFLPTIPSKASVKRVDVKFRATRVDAGRRGFER
jgi:hypothetical protein